MKAHLITLAHTSPAVIEQAEFCALSVQAWAEAAPFVHHIYTDKPDAFRRLEGSVDIRPLHSATLTEWMGRSGYSHRAKPAVLREIAHEFQGAPVFFLDADTFATAPLRNLLERVGPKEVVLYEREYNVAVRQSPMMLRFRRKLGKARFRGAPVRLDIDMWNSGIVGIHPDMVWILESWLEFLDTVYPATRRWVLEQYALAHLLTDFGVEMVASNDLFVHYWWDKPRHQEAARRLIREAKDFPGILQTIRSNPILIPRPAPRVRRANFFQRIFGW